MCYPIVYFSLESTLGCSRLLIWGLPNKAGSWQTHLSELNDEISIGAFAMDFSINFQSWNSLQLSKRSPVKKLFCWFINNKIFLWAILYSVLTVTVLYSLMNMRQLHILFNRVLNAAKPGHSADPVSAVTKKGKTLLGVKHPIQPKLDMWLFVDFCVFPWIYLSWT